MITGGDIYDVIAAMVPMYVAILLGYAAVNWWRIFTAEQCAGINRFVADFAMPLLVFKFMARNDPYAMNLTFIAADALQKVAVLTALLVWLSVGKRATLDWAITLYSLSTVPNTLVIGIPLLKAMYGDFAISLLIQVAVSQSLLWINVLMAMFEYRAAAVLLSPQNLPKYSTDHESMSFRVVDSNVVSLADQPGRPMEAESDIANDVVLRRTLSSRSDNKPSSREDNDDEAGDACNMSSGNDDGGGGNDVARGSHGLEAVNVMKIRGAATPPTVSQRNGVAGAAQKKQTPSAFVVAKLIVVTVCRNFIRNPMLYGSLAGLIWSLIAFRWNVSMPKILKGSIEILADAAIGMAMFGLGLSVALQPKIITCSKMETLISMVVRFVVAPVVTAATSIVVGLRGPVLRISIMQATLPQGVMTFVYSKVYGNQADILGTAVILGTLISLPILITYYIILGL